MLVASLREVVAYLAPVLFGLRQWRTATLHDPGAFEPDIIA